MRSRARLDFDLARGRPPEAAPALARRAEQLVGRRWRRRLAGGLERLIAAAEAPRPAFSAAVPPRRDEVRAAQPVLEALIVRLRDDAPVQARGVALVSLLLSDGASPAYTPRRPGALGDWAAGALRALPAPAHDFSLLA
jgi:hypothetical protein